MGLLALGLTAGGGLLQPPGPSSGAALWWETHTHRFGCFHGVLAKTSLLKLWGVGLFLNKGVLPDVMN